MTDDLDASLLSEAVVQSLRGHPALAAVHILHVAGDDPVVMLIAADRWTISLARQLSAEIRVEATRAQVRDRAGHPALASILTSRFREVQHRRHRVAIAHGLSEASPSPLDADAILVDRSNALLLGQWQLDLRSLVGRHRAVGGDDGDTDMCWCWSERVTWAHAMIVLSLKDGDTAPILTSEIPVRDGEPMAQICGNVVGISCPLPETLLAASTGRRLGELVATGIPALDGRLITEASVDGAVTRITLQPDLITIGEARRMQPRGPA